MAVLTRFLIALVVLIADQITKTWVNGTLKLYEQLEVTPFFNITLLYNKGAAFSFLSNAGGWQRWLFTGISAIVSIVLIVWLYRLLRHEKIMAWSLALILAGAVGNLIDRVLFGHVIDFIQVHYNNWYFPSFNVADAAISIGAVLMLYLTFVQEPEPQSEPDSTHPGN